MTNDVIVSIVADAAKVSKENVTKVISTLAQVVGELINEGCSVEVTGLGEFRKIIKKELLFTDNPEE